MAEVLVEVEAAGARRSVQLIRSFAGGGRRSVVFTYSLFSERYDSVGLREVDGVAALRLDHRGARSFSHCTLGILLSSVAIKYQLGFDLHAGSLIAPLRHPTPHGSWESAQNAALSGSTSAA
jgi:hypothetical protein